MIKTPEERAAFLELYRRGDLSDQEKVVLFKHLDSLSTADAFNVAIENVPGSAGQMVTDIWNVVTDPVGTAKGLVGLASGLVSKLVPGQQESEKYADAVGDYLYERYGGLDNFRRSFIADPVGVVSDVAGVVGTGGSLAALKGGRVGQVAGRVAAVADAVDPVTAAGKLVSKGVQVAAPKIAGSITGVGDEAVTEAYRAGREGGQRGGDFVSNMRQSRDMTDVVDATKEALEAIRKKRNQDYLARQERLAGDPTIIDFDAVEAAVDEVASIGRYGGKSLDSKATKVWDEISEIVAEWKASDPAVFHTPIGLDALKQKLRNVSEEYEIGSRSRKIADDVSKRVRSLINQTYPDYAQMMKGYEEASDLLDRLQRELSAGPNATPEQTLRKLQGVMRNNVSTSYGQRQNLVNRLDQETDKNITSQIAGQAMSAGRPRALAGVGTNLAGMGGAVGLSTGSIDPLTGVGLLASIPASSPRLVGEAAYLAGQIARRGGTQVGLLGPTVFRAALEDEQANRGMR